MTDTAVSVVSAVESLEMFSVQKGNSFFVVRVVSMVCSLRVQNDNESGWSAYAYFSDFSRSGTLA